MCRVDSPPSLCAAGRALQLCNIGMAATLLRRRQESLRVLGLNLDADPKSIKQAYKTLAKQYHPDVATGCKETAAAQFRCVAAAYELLSGADIRLDKSAAQQYEDLMAQRAREPFIIRWLWRGPSIGVKFRLKLGVMVALFVASVVDQQERSGRRRA